MKYKSANLRRIATLLAILSMLSTTSCLREGSEVSETAGIGRETEPSITVNDPSISSDKLTSESETSSGYTPPPLDGNETSDSNENPDETDNSAESESSDTLSDPTASGDKIWEFVDGKYTYNFPSRDKSAQNNLSDMASFSTAPFEDQPDDWYAGKSTYNEATGEVTYVWDRYQSTIDKLTQYKTIYRGDTSRKVCYFTFDCGYEFGTTATILDTLKEKQVPGIFFLTGQYVKEEKELIQRMLDEGHIVGNHTVGHYRGTTLTAQQFVDELQGLEDLFYAQFPDAQPMLYYRPPYGSCNEFTLKLASEKMGYQTVMWSYTYKDYDTDNQPSYSEAMEKVKSGLHPGAVYLFHTESETNAAILGDFIDWVREEGYEILPICDITFD